ncbi:MAG: magnesium transporter [Pirellulales bacterium]|nr:magnesium transporter [Pirellulales bacterium]
MMNTLYLPELREMLAADDRPGLREFCTALHAARVVEFMEGLAPLEVWTVLRASDRSTCAEVFGFLPEKTQIEILESGDSRTLSQLIADMPADDRVDLLNEVEPTIVKQLLPLVPVEERRDILRLQSYPEGTAGAVMTTEVAKLPASLNVGTALEELGRQATDLETIYYIYIVDEKDHLQGTVSARQLVTRLGKPETPLSEIMERNLVTVQANDDQEVVAKKVADYDFLAIPVVDDEQRLAGIVTYDDVIDVLREEAEEDAYLAAAVEPLQAGYLQTSLIVLTWKRGFWLFTLFIAALLTAFALKSYQQVIDQVGWLVFFIPLIMSSGGNSGGQSATLVIRALSNKDIGLSDARRVLARELLMGLFLGSALSVVGYVVGWLMLPAPPTGPTPVELLTIPITLLVVVLFGSLCGAGLPLLFRRLGVDEALMSTPFVTVLIDIGGILIYMMVAMKMIDGLIRTAGPALTL